MKNQVKQSIHRIKTNWYVWLFPLFAVGISVWLFVSYLDQQGPTIKISFEDASSIREEKTRIRFRGVTIGTVKKMQLSDDNGDVILTVVLHKTAQNFALEGAKYWLVTPKVGFQGISGLDTLFEGTYIAASPGSSKGGEKTDFKGQLGKEAEQSTEDTTSYQLETPFVESVSVGDPVSFRGLNIGNVSKVNLSKTAQSILVQVNIQNRYTKLVRVNSLFWRKTGVHANLGLFNSEVKISSLESLMKGGIDLFTPEPAGPMAKANAHFGLNPEAPKGWEKWNPKLEYDTPATKL